jgi:hypothetical protein
LVRREIFMVPASLIALPSPAMSTVKLRPATTSLGQPVDDYGSRIRPCLDDAMVRHRDDHLYLSCVPAGEAKTLAAPEF